MKKDYKKLLKDIYNPKPYRVLLRAEGKNIWDTKSVFDKFRL